MESIRYIKTYLIQRKKKKKKKSELIFKLRENEKNVKEKREKEREKKTKRYNTILPVFSPVEKLQENTFSSRLTRIRSLSWPPAKSIEQGR